MIAIVTKQMSITDAFFRSEALPGIVPNGCNIPQRNKHNLYAERLSGTSFTTARKDTKQTLLYRLRPTVAMSKFEPVSGPTQDEPMEFLPQRSACAPPAIDQKADFVRGLTKIGGAGDPTLKEGMSYYVLLAGRDMPPDQAYATCDGDLLLVPQQGTLDVRTELGRLRVRPRELVVIPRGIKFQVTLPDGPVRAYGVEIFGGHFDLPELGPIGTYGLANIRDFEVPTADFDDSDTEMHITIRMAGHLHTADYPGSIFNVAGWHGTSYPYKYDLGKFNTFGSISYDHPDPSIFTVLTCPSAIPGEAALDVVLFGPRWLVMEDCFRPPYYHMNTMSEFIFLVEGGFDIAPLPKELHGMCSLTNTMVPHGPAPDAFKKAVAAKLEPFRIGDDNCGIMFESRYVRDPFYIEHY